MIQLCDVFKLLSCACFTCDRNGVDGYYLQAAFRTTCVLVPDASIILAARMMAEGFGAVVAARLSKKLVWLFSSIRNSLSIPRVPAPSALHTVPKRPIDERLEHGDSRYVLKPCIDSYADHCLVPVDFSIDLL